MGPKAPWELFPKTLTKATVLAAVQEARRPQARTSVLSPEHPSFAKSNFKGQARPSEAEVNVSDRLGGTGQG